MKEVYINARFLTQKITGAQRFAIELSKKIIEINPHVKFVAPKHIIHHDLAKEFKVETYGKFNSHLWEQFELPRFLRKKNKPLLINFCNTAPLFYKKQIVSILDLSFFVNPSWFSKKFTMLYKFLVPRIARKSQHIITISENSKKDIINILNIPQEKVDIIHCSIPETLENVDAINIENKFGKYILAVSSIDPRKNFYNLILAFNQLKLDDYRLLIVGNQNKVFSDNNLKTIINDNPSIVFSGYVSDEELIGLYKNAQLFAYPSLYEGFGIPPLEAMACGCPTIVSNTASLPEVCGDASYYIDNPNDAQQIAANIQKLLNQPELSQDLIQKGYEQIKLFSWQKSAQKVVDLIENQLN